MKILGIIGGMGPEATVNMFAKVIRSTLATCDQEHLEVVVHNNNKIPDRTQAILSEGASPLPELIRSVSILISCGVDLIIIPCMTSHYFLSYIQEKSSVPVMNAIREVADFLSTAQHTISRVGLLATTGTVKTCLFQNELEQVGIRCILPNEADQENLVMNAIYGVDGIKAGNCGGQAKLKLCDAAEHLVAAGAEAIIAGCTEIPLALSKDDISVQLIDPIEVMAVRAIQFCGGRVRQDNQ